MQKQEIEVIAPKAWQLKRHTKPQPKTIQTPRGDSLAEDVSVTQSPVQKPQISGARREQFYGNFIFYTGIHELSEDFLKSFKHYVFALRATEYDNFEASPIDVCRASVDAFYTSPVATTTRVDRDRA